MIVKILPRIHQKSLLRLLTFEKAKSTQQHADTVTLLRFHQVKLAHKSVSAQKKSKVRKR